MAALAPDVSYKPVPKGRPNNYRRLWIDAENQIRELRHELANVEAALAWTTAELEKRS
jgi:hypothetical protein